MQLNVSKTITLNISMHKELSMIGNHTIYQHIIETVPQAKLVGVVNDEHLSCSQHVEKTSSTHWHKIHGLLVLKQCGVNWSSPVYPMSYRESHTQYQCGFHSPLRTSRKF